MLSDKVKLIELKQHETLLVKELQTFSQTVSNNELLDST